MVMATLCRLSVFLLVSMSLHLVLLHDGVEGFADVPRNVPSVSEIRQEQGLDVLVLAENIEVIEEEEEAGKEEAEVLAEAMVDVRTSECIHYRKDEYVCPDKFIGGLQSTCWWSVGPRQKKIAVCLPRFVNLGVQKSGTSALYETLVKDSQVVLGIKEPHVLGEKSDVLQEVGLAQWLDRFQGQSNTIMTSENKRLVYGEASACTLWFTSFTPKLAAEQLLPHGVRLSVLLRNPTDRGVSAFYWFRRWCGPNPSPDWTCQREKPVPAVEEQLLLDQVNERIAEMKIYPELATLSDAWRDRCTVDVGDGGDGSGSLRLPPLDDAYRQARDTILGMNMKDRPNWIVSGGLYVIDLVLWWRYINPGDLLIVLNEDMALPETLPKFYSHYRLDRQSAFPKWSYGKAHPKSTTDAAARAVLHDFFRPFNCLLATALQNRKILEWL